MSELPEQRSSREHELDFGREVVPIRAGEYHIAQGPVVIGTTLGSCLAACVRDPETEIGGMNHFMLPLPSGLPGKGPASWEESARYGCRAMDDLVQGVLEYGGTPGKLEVKLFGGANLSQSRITSGDRSREWVLDYLSETKLRLTASRLGGDWPRKICYFLNTGRVVVQKMPQVDQILRDEEDYLRSVRGRGV